MNRHLVVKLLVPWERLELPILSALVSKTRVYAFHHQGNKFLERVWGIEPQLHGLEGRRLTLSLPALKQFLS